MIVHLQIEVLGESLPFLYNLFQYLNFPFVFSSLSSNFIFRNMTKVGFLYYTIEPTGFLAWCAPLNSPIVLVHVILFNTELIHIDKVTSISAGIEPCVIYLQVTSPVRIFK